MNEVRYHREKNNELQFSIKKLNKSNEDLINVNSTLKKELRNMKQKRSSLLGDGQEPFAIEDGTGGAR